MQKGNTLLYHNHIINGIVNLDQRKDGYIGHRLQFLDQYCAPVRKRIQNIKQDIKYYENMRDTAYEVIQSQSDIMHLKKQITDYKSTNAYYDGKLNQFDHSIALLQVNNKQKKQLLEKKKQQVKNLFNQNGGTLNTISRSKTKYSRNQSIKDLTSITTTAKGAHDHSLNKIKSERGATTNNQINSLHNSRSQVNTQVVNDETIEEQQNIKLPHISAKRNIKYYMKNNQQKQLQRHYRNQDRLDKVIKQSQNYRSLRNSTFMNPQSAQDTSIQLNVNSVKQIKNAIAQFDHAEALFRDCFQRRKLLVQKSVSQLQSRLISNKELFLQACQVIGKKQGYMSIQDFNQLSTDQIVTLFISFGWMSRKVYNQFTQKRKKLTEILKQIKIYQQIN